MAGRVLNSLLAFLFATFYWLYSRTWFYRRVNVPRVVEQNERCVYAHWHGDELLLVGAFVGSGMAVMTSRSKDGSFMGRVLTLLGFSVVRGSSSRGGAGGLKGLIDHVNKNNKSASLAVDGPRGPIYQVKPGVLKLAQQTGAWLVPGAAAASRKWTSEKAWNKAYLPWPFSKCVIVYGTPVKIPLETSDEQFEAFRSQVESQLSALKLEAERFVEPRQTEQGEAKPRHSQHAELRGEPPLKT